MCGLPRPRLRHIGWSVSRLALLMVGVSIAFALSVAVVLLYWRAEGKQVLGVQTGSMRPLVEPGDAVIVQPVGGRQPALSVGEVVAYRSLADESVVVTHRITRIDSRSGWITTKGDASAASDPVIPPRLVVGRVEAVAPRLGVVLTTARQPAVLALLVYMPALILVMSEFRRLYRHFAGELYRYHGVRAPGFSSERATSGKL